MRRQQVGHPVGACAGADVNHVQCADLVGLRAKKKKKKKKKKGSGNVSLRIAPDRDAAWHTHGKGTSDRVQASAVVEQRKLPGLPIDDVNVFGRDPGALQLVQELAGFLQVGDVCAVRIQRRLCTRSARRHRLHHL